MVTVIIPAHNEASHIGAVLARVGRDYDVVVVDDGSYDNTRDVVRSHGHVPVIHRINRGKSSACITGIRKSKSDRCVFIDGDCQLNAHEIPRVLDALDHADIAIGERDYRQIPWARRLSNRYAAWCVNYIAGTNFRDALCGFRAVRRNAFQKLRFKKQGYFFESEMIIRAAEQNLGMRSVLVSVDYSIGSRMPLSKSMRIAGWLTYLALKKAITRR